jgi:4a-hydroxytetrahydrobiopterin dehydratase
MTFHPTVLVPATRAAGSPQVDVVAAPDIPREQVEAARRRIASVQRSVSRPLVRLQLTLHHADPDSTEAYAADVSVLFNGRLLTARATGATVLTATNAAALRLRRRLWHAAGAHIPSLRDLARDRDVACALAEEERRGWRRQGEALVRDLTFRDFDQAMRFVRRIAQRAVDYLRRPDMCILDFNRVRLTIANLHHAPLTLAEVRLAAKVDTIIAEHQPDVIALPLERVSDDESAEPAAAPLRRVA